MRISELLREETITTTLQNTEKKAIIEELMALAEKTGNVKDHEQALQAVMEREEMMSTGLERGVAIPHAKTNSVENLTLALGISREGVDFESADGKPSHLFFLLMAPEAAAGPNIKVLAQIARLASDPAFTETLRQAAGPADVLNAIRSMEME